MFDDVVTLLADRLSTRFLAARVMGEDPSALRTSTILGAPAAITALAEALEDRARSTLTLELVRSAVPFGLPSSATLADIWPDPVAADSAANLLFGSGRRRVAAVVSAETGVSVAAANETVTLSVLAVFATIAQRFGQADQQTIGAALAVERREMSARGWDLWLDTVYGRPLQPPVQPAATSTPAHAVEPLPPVLPGEPARTHSQPIDRDVIPQPPREPTPAQASHATNNAVLPAAPEAPTPPLPSTDHKRLEPGVPPMPPDDGVPLEPGGPPMPPDDGVPLELGGPPMPPDDGVWPEPDNSLPDNALPDVALPTGLLPDGDDWYASAHDPAPNLVPPTEVDHAAAMAGQDIDVWVTAGGRSDRSDEVLRVIGGVLVLLAIMLAIALMQYWQGDNTNAGSADDSSIGPAVIVNE